MEDDKVFVYHNLENSRMLHDAELQCIEVEPPVSRHNFVHFMVHIIIIYHCHSHSLPDKPVGDWTPRLAQMLSTHRPMTDLITH